MLEVLKGLEVSLGVSAELNYQRRCPAVINSAKETEEALRAASAVVGSDRVDSTISPVMNSEDFSFMLNSVPGAFLFMGAGQPSPNGMNHQPGYDFNDRLLSIGADYWVSLVESLLPETLHEER
jgi:hippurate hydrolase